jgi:hypothetical protein
MMSKIIDLNRPLAHKVPRPPAKLSAWAREEWARLHELHDFERYEDLVLTRSLRWFDLSDKWLAQAERAKSEKQRRVLIAQARDASQTGLRFWRALKFSGDDPTRRAGRPSDRAWSSQRSGAI